METESNSAKSPSPVGSGRPQVPELSEDAALAALAKVEIGSQELAELSRNRVAATSRKVMLGLVAHSRTPRHVSLPLLRRMFTFDLVRVTLAPAVAADIKRSAEEQILKRLESMPVGQKISLARRASTRIAAELLRDPDRRVQSVALDGARLTESSVVAALRRPDSLPALFDQVSKHAKWSQRREVQIALLGSEKTPLTRAAQLAGNFSAEFLSKIVPSRRKLTLAQAAAGAERHRR
jgi:hypothetical protein